MIIKEQLDKWLFLCRYNKTILTESYPAIIELLICELQNKNKNLDNAITTIVFNNLCCDTLKKCSTEEKDVEKCKKCWKLFYETDAKVLF